ncbi:MAG: hypothetical protein L3J22_01530 [Xanthomonadales bacterium]|nr:hypothetical protein [Xanthomonadales bacterium]
MSKITEALCADEALKAQKLVRKLIAEHTSPWQQPDLQEYCRMRWTSRFLTAAEQNKKAMGASGRRAKKEPREALLRRFLSGHDFDVPLYDAPLKRVKTDVTFLFVPGMLNGMLPVRAFVPAMETVAAQTGIRFLRADVHPLAPPDANSVDIVRAIEEGIGLDSGGRLIPKVQRQPVAGKIVLMGYSKGMPDITAFLVNYPKLAERVVAVVSWAGANGGAYAADSAPTELLSMVEVSDHKQLQTLLHLVGMVPLAGNYKPLRRSEEARPGACFAALQTAAREAFWKAHSTTLDNLGIPFFTFAGCESPLSVPWFQLKDSLSLLTHSAENDMQLTRAQANVPLANRVEMPLLHGHHWDLSYPAFPMVWSGGSRKLSHPFPKSAALSAHVGLLADLGLW